MKDRDRRATARGLGLDDLHRLLTYHRALLADAARNCAFQRALVHHVKRGSTVLDIGAGTGVWAVAAARRGARRVVAVEKEPLLVPCIEAAARDNGVADRIEVIGGDSRRLDLPREFDVVVSETIGNEAFDEDIVSILTDARRRLLKPRGAVVPEAVFLMAAPARLASRPERMPAGMDLDWGFFDRLAVHLAASPRGRIRLLARAAALAKADLTRTADAPVPAEVAGRWRVADRRRLDGFVVWPEARLAPGVRLRGLSGTAWSPRLYPTEPLPSGPGQVGFRLFLDGAERRWEVLHRGPGGETRAPYSSLFAYGALRPRVPSR